MTRWGGDSPVEMRIQAVSAELMVATAAAAAAGPAGPIAASAAPIARAGVTNFFAAVVRNCSASTTAAETSPTTEDDEDGSGDDILTWEAAASTFMEEAETERVVRRAEKDRPERTARGRTDTTARAPTRETPTTTLPLERIADRCWNPIEDIVVEPTAKVEAIVGCVRVYVCARAFKLFALPVAERINATRRSSCATRV